MSEHRTTYACTCGHRHHIASKQAEHRRVADVEARADLVARIVAAVEGLRVRGSVKDETPWQQGFRQSRNETVAAVLTAIREASK